MHISCLVHLIYKSHTIIETVNELEDKADIILEKYRNIKENISCVKLDEKDVELSEEEQDSFFFRFDYYIKALLAEDISTSELKNLVMHINEIISNITKNLSLIHI